MLTDQLNGKATIPCIGSGTHHKLRQDNLPPSRRTTVRTIIHKSDHNSSPSIALHPHWFHIDIKASWTTCLAGVELKHNAIETRQYFNITSDLTKIHQ